MLPRRKTGVFTYSNWDVVPVVCGVLHFAYLVAMVVYFPILPWWSLILLGLVYAVSISWNINGISHNHIHNPYFVSPALNKAFDLLESLTMGFSQTFYWTVHMRHHVGNSDRQDDKGDTIDWLSIYRHGRDGLPENVWAYTFKGYFRDDIGTTYREMKRRDPAEARFGVLELVLVVVGVAFLLWFNWKFVLFLLPFYYLGHSLSSLNGFYEHLGSNPDLPIAWGVSNYNWLYNITWFFNGYHAEHHYRPKQHWTKMVELHRQIAEEQKAAGVRVISWPHALGFLDKSLKAVKTL